MTPLALAALLALAQTELTIPGIERQGGASDVHRRYGEPTQVDLASVASGSHDKDTVRVRGILGFLEGGDAYYELSDGGSRVVLIVVPELRQMLTFIMGRRVEVVGLVRLLVPDQGQCPVGNGRLVPQSYCDDPLLPITPDMQGARSGWPRVSVTAWAVTDVSEGGTKPQAAAADESALSGPPDTKVTVVGRFRGANLEADLPGPPPATGAWVLTVGTRSIWVLGRRPEGRGFKLDPAYRGDLGRWLEVAGRLTPCAAGTCLKASGVVLATPPVTDP